ncbi:hypothetical protein [Cupriavidus metallidurans]|uniref:hypothetical protein n=1 Tax=Cupriavidus metallidurans TaxID=119219 RepID=UPI000B0DC693|nr:hypothetical protein [Cupriavidus metallidurans]QGS33044.1 hypothetical protein FOB83_30135 [Cupriavidus metallidurans]
MSGGLVGGMFDAGKARISPIRLIVSLSISTPWVRFRYRNGGLAMRGQVFDTRHWCVFSSTQIDNAHACNG